MNWPAWIEVDLDALRHNLHVIKNHTSAQICVVLKADAYGHGAPFIARFLSRLGVRYAAVSDLEEAIEIRTISNVPLLMLTPPLLDQLDLILRHNITPTVSSPDLVFALGKLAARRRQLTAVHLKVDTGLGRLGVAPNRALELAEQIQVHQFLRLEGVFTHFARAFYDVDYTNRQLHELLELKRHFEKQGWNDILWHSANSAAFSTLQESHLDMVRVGTILYGQSPQPLDADWDLKNAWSFHTRIIQTKEVPPATAIGYGTTFRTKRKSIIGVIPVGYSDGLELEPQSTPATQLRRAAARILGRHNRFVQIRGQRVPIVGKVAMGLTTLDLTDVPDPHVGLEVTVPLRRVTVSRRIPKVYKENGRIRAVWHNKGSLLYPNSELSQ